MNQTMAPVSTRLELGGLLRSVVKVHCVADAPDYEQPWQSTGPTSSSGSGGTTSGFYLGNERIGAREFGILVGCLHCDELRIGEP